MMRTTAGSAISTARTTGSVTLPPGLPLAYVVDAVTVVLMIKRHANPITSITRKNQLARCDCVSVDPDLYIISNLPLVTEEKHSWKLNTSYHIQTRIRTISEIGCTVPFTFVRNRLLGVCYLRCRLGSAFVPVGAGEGLCGEGTLASPWQEGKCAQGTGRGRRKRPLPIPHLSRPYRYILLTYKYKLHSESPQLPAEASPAPPLS